MLFEASVDFILITSRILCFSSFFLSKIVLLVKSFGMDTIVVKDIITNHSPCLIATHLLLINFTTSIIGFLYVQLGKLTPSLRFILSSISYIYPIMVKIPPFGMIRPFLLKCLAFLRVLVPQKIGKTIFK